MSHDTKAKPPAFAMSVDDAADYSGLGRTTLFELIKNKDLPSKKIGARRLILTADLENFVLNGLGRTRTATNSQGEGR